MDIYIYSDESGVFDKLHNDIFIFGGIMCFGSKERDFWSRKFRAAEKAIESNYANGLELKAANISNKDKGKLFRSLNQCIKFCCIINQHRVLNQIFLQKKDKQRYLDYAYKMAVKNAFECLIKKSVLNPDDVEHLHFYIDEHSTATSGCYELHEGLEQEFRFGTYNMKYDRFYPPIFRRLKSVNVNFCNSKSKLLVRAADIVSNRVWHAARMKESLESIMNLYVRRLP